MSLRIVAACVIFASSIAATRGVVVTTTDNGSTAGDGKTSLLEALTALSANETITFNIPGAGPHYIATPAGGYPLITLSGVTINGFSQPGASPNSAGPKQVRNEVIKIVLDSRTETPNERRTILDYPGFSSGESCVLGLLNAQNVLIRGMAFIGVAGDGSEDNAYVYNVALLQESKGTKIQGCWFGLDPGVTSWLPSPSGEVAGVHGARSAVASFKWTGGLNSSGLIFGTDGNASGDEGEGNICMAQRLAVHLETPNVRVAGNWFNFFPDGSFLNPISQNLTLEDGTLEAIENGDGASMIIGTNGDGIGDEVEGNIFGPIVYDVYAEFWRPAVGVVFAGNSVGVNLFGLPAFSSPGTGLLNVRKDSSFRIGPELNFEPTAQREGNIIAGLGDGFIAWHSSNNELTGKPARINIRRNELIGNEGRIPLSQSAAVTPQRVFADAMSNPGQPDVIISNTTNALLLKGTVPAPAGGVSPPSLDIYLADSFGLYNSAPQSRVWLATRFVDGAGDLDSATNAFSFDISALALTAAEVQRLTATASYSFIGGRAVTNFATPLGGTSQPPPLGPTKIARSGAAIDLSWTNGTAPYLIITATDIRGPWSRVGTTPNHSVILPFDGPKRYYRIYEGAPPR